VLSGQCFVKGIIMCTLMVIEVCIIGYRCDILSFRLSWFAYTRLEATPDPPRVVVMVLRCLDDVILLL
jgi:hypothetical protein